MPVGRMWGFISSRPFGMSLVFGADAPVRQNFVDHPFVSHESTGFLVHLAGFRAADFSALNISAPSVGPAIIKVASDKWLDFGDGLFAFVSLDTGVEIVLAAPLAIPRTTIRHCEDECDRHFPPPIFPAIAANFSREARNSASVFGLYCW
jgi:hypothetical protein